MHETNSRGCLRDGFEAETCKRADMATDGAQRDTEGWEIRGIERAFVTASGDSDDAAEGGGALE